MAEVVEGSTVEQIKAIEGWALQCYQESVKKNPNVNEILENLRKINTQARKLDRTGNFKNLEKSLSVNSRGFTRMAIAELVLDRRIRNPSQEKIQKQAARFQAEQQQALEKIENLKKKITQLRAAAVVSLRKIKIKDKGLKDDSKLTIRILFTLATEAVKITIYVLGTDSHSKLLLRDYHEQGLGRRKEFQGL